MSGLGQLGVSALKWGTAATLARFVLQLGVQVVLARTLGPEIFGIFGIGMVVLTFAGFMTSFGFSWSLLQRATVQAEDVRFALTWQVLVGLLTMASVYALAPWLAAYFREPRAQFVIEWLSLACLLTAASGPSTYLLQRDLNFRAVGLIQVGSYAVGYLMVGIPMALLGWGAAALVAAWLVQASVVLLASYSLKPHALRPLFWYAGAAMTVNTGRAVFITNIVNWLLNNMDRVMIGRLLNAQALGLYNAAYNMATLPNSVLLSALQPAFLAAGAKLQDQLPRLGRVYLQMVATVLVLIVPAFVFLALIAGDLVHLLYGPAWLEAGWVLQILFLSMPAYVVWGLSTPVLWNTGHKHYEFALQLPLVLVGLAGFYAFAGLGLRSAAAVAAALLVLRALVLSLVAMRALKLQWPSLLPHAARGLLFSALCVMGVWLGQNATAGYDSAWLSLLASGLLSLAAVIVTIALWPQFLGAEAIDMVLRFFPRLTVFFNRKELPKRTDVIGEQRPQDLETLT
jgi:O-antigen/teichoic acid export membrane protein